jgi:hypothetical protein
MLGYRPLQILQGILAIILIGFFGLTPEPHQLLLLRKSFIHNQRFLISSRISYGRLSNMKISITEIIGLSMALNRTAVLPKLESCFSEDVTDNEVFFDDLFDTSAFSRVSIISTSFFDFDKFCGKEDVAVIRIANSVGQEVVDENISLNDIVLKGTLPFNNVSLTSSSFPYNKYFLPIYTSWIPEYIKDHYLPDKLATLQNYRCIVLGTNFMSLNWSRLPREFEQVHKELVPSQSIRKDVQEFFQNLGLLSTSPNYLASINVKPFIAIHLRMGDFLNIDSHLSFGMKCNKNPELLEIYVNEALKRFKNLSFDSESVPLILLSTDDYQSTCALNLQRKFSIVVLDGVSRFQSASCSCALFDQEVLGAAVIFFGDKKSTFSQSIHQIRTLRNLHGVDTTVWL